MINSPGKKEGRIFKSKQFNMSGMVDDPNNNGRRKSFADYQRQLKVNQNIVYQPNDALTVSIVTRYQTAVFGILVQEAP